MGVLGRKFGAGVIAAVLLSTALAGCGSKSTNAPSTPQAPAPSTEAKDVTFTYLEGQIITTADPAQHTDESSLIAVVNLYDPLVYPKVAEGSMEPGPSVAQKWAVSDDGKSYTFQLKSGIKFHDGTELTADDVVYSMERMLAMKKGFSWLWNGVLLPGKTTAPDKNTVKFELTQPYAPFLGTLEQLFIVNKKLLTANKAAGTFGDNGDFGAAYLDSHDAGSGPYTMAGFGRDSELTLKQFKEYWKGWKPGQVTTVHYKVVKEEATQKTVLTSGQADMIDQWHSSEYYAELAKLPDISVPEAPSVQLYHVTMNVQKAPLDDVHFRAAIAYAFDYEAAAKSIFGGAAIAQGPVPNKTLWHNDAIPAMKRDLDKAKAELAQSKYKGSPQKVTLLYINTNDQERKTGLLLQQNLKDIGIDVELVAQPWAQIVEATVKKETTPHMVAIFDTLKYPHPDSHTYGIYHSSAKGSYRAASWLNDPALDKVLDDARKTIDSAKQADLYKAAQKTVADQYPSLYIVNPTHRVALKKYVKGYQYVGLLGFDVNFYDFTIQK